MTRRRRSARSWVGAWVARRVLVGVVVTVVLSLLLNPWVAGTVTFICLGLIAWHHRFLVVAWCRSIKETWCGA